MNECTVLCPEVLDQDGGAAMYKSLLKQWSRRSTAIVLDFASTDSIDSLGGAWIMKAAGYARQKGVDFSWKGQHDALSDFLEMLAPSLQASPPARPKMPGPLEKLGEVIISVTKECGEFLSLTVDTIYWTLIARETRRILS